MRGAPSPPPLPPMELTAMAMPRLLVALLLHFLPRKLLSLLLPSTWHSPPDNDASASPARPPPPESAAGRAAAHVDPSELTRVFRMFDRDGDGRITRAELAGSLENLGIYIADEELAAVIARVDVDGDGCVDAEEFAALHRAIMEEEEEEGPAGGAGEEEMREAFEVFDQNGDGFITAEELRSVLASLGVRQGRTPEDCRRMISTVDADGNGMVDFKEFKQMMGKGGGLAAVG